MPVRIVEGDEFREVMRPLIHALRVLAAAVDDVPERHGRTPWNDSLGMREVADERDYAERSGWDQPIHSTHLLGQLTLRAAADYVRTFAKAFAVGTTPVYGHLVLARAALEACVVCEWLSEPGVARDERMKRGLSEFLYTAIEENRLGVHPDVQRVQTWLDRSDNLGWPPTDRAGKRWTRRSRGKPLIAGVGRPPTGEAITRLLVTDEDAQLGRLLWSRLSAVAHVTFFGLKWGLMTDTQVAHPLSPGLATVGLGTESKQVYTQALCIARALRLAASALFELMGWQDAAWLAAAQTAEQQERELVRALAEASTPSG